jgi:hypothetical protein
MSTRDYGIAAPHGPNMDTDKHVATKSTHSMNLMEEEVFKSIILPDDMYDQNTGTYWADMGFMQQFQFVSQVNSAETKKELSSIWGMIKHDPLSPLGSYARNMIIPGMGLGLEGYVLFSIGNIRPLLQAAFPACWSKFSVCNETWSNAIDYLEVSGIIVGQVSRCHCFPKYKLTCPGPRRNRRRLDRP